MNDKIDLLPLPEKKRLAVRYERSFGSVTAYGHDDDTLRDYARANIAHAVAPLHAEIERLRGALKEIKGQSALIFATHPIPFTLTAILGEIYQIAIEALAQED